MAITACIAELGHWLESNDEATPRPLDLEARHEDGGTALHAAAANNSAPIVAALLNAGANPGSLDDRLRPPIYLTDDKATRDAFR